MKPTKRNSRPAILAAAIALLYAGAVQAQQDGTEVGKLIFANGDVSIVGKDGRSRPAKQGDLIAPGERVVTGDGALAQVKMLDGGRVGVRPDSSVGFDPPATAIAGAPTVLTLQSGDVRVLNMQLSDKIDPKEYVLKTTDGVIQLDGADTIASLRAPTTGNANAPKETLVRLSAGNAVVSNKGGSVRNVAVNQLIAVTPTEVKTGAVGVVPAPPRVSTRVTTATDRLSRQVALTTPLESTGARSGLGVRAPLSFAYDAPAGFSTKGYQIDPKTIDALPRTLRVESKLTPDPVSNTPYKPVAPPAQVAAVKGNELPSLIVPPTSIGTLTVTSPTITKTLTPVISGSVTKTLPTTFDLSTAIKTSPR